MSRTSIFAFSIAARTARQRRSSSGVEIGVFRRSDKAIGQSPKNHSPRGGLANDVDHAPRIIAQEAPHVLFDRRHGAILVAVRIAAEMREYRQILGLPERARRWQRLFRENIEGGAGDLAALQSLDQGRLVDHASARD